MDIKEIHEKACRENRDSYQDPLSGNFVFTRIYHLRRGSCCDSGCRHCPYRNVPVSESSS